jgi:hypothetical protein
MFVIWSLTVKGEHRPRLLENRVMSKIFGLKRNDVTGDWRRLHNEKLHPL